MSILILVVIATTYFAISSLLQVSEVVGNLLGIWNQTFYSIQRGKLVWFGRSVGCVLQHINSWRLFNAKSCLYICVKYITYKGIVCRLQLLNRTVFICFHTVKWFQVLQFSKNNFICTQWSGFKYFCYTLVILFNIICLYTIKCF